MADVKRRHEILSEALGMGTRILSLPWDRIALWRKAPDSLPGVYDLHDPDPKKLGELVDLANQTGLWNEKKAGPVVVKINSHYFPLTEQDLQAVERQRKESKSKRAIVLEIYKTKPKGAINGNTSDTKEAVTIGIETKQ